MKVATKKNSKKTGAGRKPAPRKTSPVGKSGGRKPAATRSVPEPAESSAKTVRPALESKIQASESRPAETVPPVTLQASRRFWLLLLGSVVVVVALIQGYGYFTGWGNPEKLIQRYFNTAQRLTLAKRYPAAIRQYQKVLNLSEDQETIRQAQIALADLHREKQDWPVAISIYRELQASEPGTVMSAWTGLQIAESQQASGEHEAALQSFRSVQADFPQTDWDAEARLGIGKVHESQKQYAEAISVYRSLETDYRGGFLAAEALLHIGQCYAKVGNQDAARRAFQNILDNYPATMIDDAKKYLKRLDTNTQPEGISLWGE